MANPSGQMENMDARTPEGTGGRGTLDEPIKETIMRDLTSIAVKLKYVMLPRARVDKAVRSTDNLKGGDNKIP